MIFYLFTSITFKIVGYCFIHLLKLIARFLSKLKDLSHNILIFLPAIELTTLPERRSLKGFISTKMTDVVMRFLACMCFLIDGMVRIFFKTQNTEILDEVHQTTWFPNSNSQDACGSTERLSIHPCCQKLQHLEDLVNELTKRPARIPPEKDEILLESMNRIKSIEQDLQKTRKVRLTCCFCNINSIFKQMCLKLG